MKRKFRNNGLSIVLFLLFTISIIGQFFQGHMAYNDERKNEHLASLTYKEYLSSGHFISSVSENMESEFLQMALFVFLTMCLYQKGSAESNKLPEEKTPEDISREKAEQDYCEKKRKRNPILWSLYENSLTLTLTIFFVLFFLIHAYGTMKTINIERLAADQSMITYIEVFKENEFWFESFQNWQSEFFSIAILGILSIFLRQRNSSQSKKMNDAHSKTGDH